MFRFFHAAEVVGRKIVIHGGWDGSQVFNDTWIFNTDTFVWIQVKNLFLVYLLLILMLINLISLKPPALVQVQDTGIR